jgi:hypothetical protein
VNARDGRPSVFQTYPRGKRDKLSARV